MPVHAQPNDDSHHGKSRRVTNTWRRAARAVAAWILVASVYPASALNIQLTFDASTPYFDVNGIDQTYSIVPIMEAAAAMWEDIIEDTHTLNVTYRWEDLTGANNTNGPAAVVSYTHTANRGVNATIRFDTHLNPSGDAKRWFFDPTPFANEEHSVGQALYRDISAQEQAAWYSGSVPGVFETSFWGTALPTAPDDARFGNDLLSVALHELGHPLGIPGSSNGLGDDDYDVQPSQVGGNVMAIISAPPDHLPNSKALVAGGIGDWRKLPSVTDILATASTSLWTQIDLPRKDLLDVAGGDDWNTPGNWIGNRLPDADDNVYLRDGGGTQFGSLSGAGVAGNLFVTDGAWLTTNQHTLDVQGVATVDGTETGGFSGRLITQAGGVLAADLLVAANGGELFINADSTLRINYLVHPDPLSIDGNLEVGHFAKNSAGFIVFGGASLNPSLFVDGTTTIGAEAGATGHVRVESLGNAATKTVVVGTRFSEGRIDVDGGYWHVDGSLIVGQDEESAKGSLYLSNSGFMEVDGSATIRRGQASQGLVGIRSGSTLDLSHFLNIPAGGVVAIQDDFSQLFADTIDVSGGEFNLLGGTVVATVFQNTGGTFVHDDGTLIVHGPFNPGTPGYSISGAAPGNSPTLELRNGGSASFTDIVRVGENGGGAVVVVNPGTRIDATHDIFDVGLFGAGRLEVYDGAVVNHTGTFVMNLGFWNGSSGEVIVNGEDSRIDTAALMIVGDHGQGSLDVVDGGKVTAARMWISHFNDAQPSTVTVSGTSVGPAFDPSLLTIGGDLFVSGDDLQGSGVAGTLTVAEDAAVDVANLLKIWPAGRVQLDGGNIGAAHFDVEAGTLAGEGVVLLNFAGELRNAGNVAPGLSPGTLAVAGGDYIQEPSGALAIELASAASHDQLLVVDGRADLAGVLDVSLIAGYVPRANDSFDILVAPSSGVVGEFDVVSMPLLPGALGWELIYNEADVTLLFTTPFTADFDLDGDVDDDDLAVWAEHYGVDAGADADGDLDTDGRDLLEWQRQFGGGLLTRPASTTVPEPATFALWLATAFIALSSRRR